MSRNKSRKMKKKPVKQQKHQSPLTSYRNKKLLAKFIKLLRSLQWAPFPAGGHTGNTQCRTTTANHPHPRSPTYRIETPQIIFDPHSDTDRSPTGVKREPKKRKEVVGITRSKQ